RDVESDHAGPLVKLLRFGDRLTRQDLRDVRPLVAHRDHGQAGFDRVLLFRPVQAGQDRADRLPKGQAGEGVNDRRIPELQEPDMVLMRLPDDRLDNVGDVPVKLGDPGRIVKLVEVFEQRPLFPLLQDQKLFHLVLGGDRVEAVLLHQLPGDLDRDRPVDMLVQLRLFDPRDLRIDRRPFHRPLRIIHLPPSSSQYLYARKGSHIAPVADITASTPALKYSRIWPVVITPPTPITAKSYFSFCLSSTTRAAWRSAQRRMAEPQTPERSLPSPGSADVPRSLTTSNERVLIPAIPSTWGAFALITRESRAGSEM